MDSFPRRRVSTFVLFSVFLPEEGSSQPHACRSNQSPCLVANIMLCTCLSGTYGAKSRVFVTSVQCINPCLPSCPFSRVFFNYGYNSDNFKLHFLPAHVCTVRCKHRNTSILISHVSFEVGVLEREHGQDGPSTPPPQSQMDHHFTFQGPRSTVKTSQSVEIELDIIVLVEDRVSALATTQKVRWQLVAYGNLEGKNNNGPDICHRLWLDPDLFSSYDFVKILCCTTAGSD